MEEIDHGWPGHGCPPNSLKSAMAQARPNPTAKGTLYLYVFRARCFPRNRMRPPCYALVPRPPTFQPYIDCEQAPQAPFGYNKPSMSNSETHHRRATVPRLNKSSTMRLTRFTVVQKVCCHDETELGSAESLMRVSLRQPRSWKDS